MIRPRINRIFAACLAAVLLVGLSASLAHADTTHPFLGHITLTDGTNPQPMGVDNDGNLIIWLNDQKVVAKFDTDGNPVPFTGLGTHILDGKGTFDCPTTLSDCDRVITNGFGSESHNQDNSIVAVDNSGGPADGYIYVMNNQHPQFTGEIDVFDETGTFLGIVNQQQAYPAGGDALQPSQGINVTKSGVLVVVKNHGTLSRINRYVPIDADPANMEFNGQLRARCGNTLCIAADVAYNDGVAGDEYTYAAGYDRTHTPEGGTASYYMRYPTSEYFRQGLFNFAVSDDFSPEIGPFGDGGRFPPFNGNLDVVGMDPETEHVYIGTGWAGFEEWNQNNEQVGPAFGGDLCPGTKPGPQDPECPIASYFDLDSIAFDRSGGPNDGHIYMKGPESNEIAVFGNPVIIPDINVTEAVGKHNTAHLEANIGLAGGPAVTECKLEYGPEAATPGQTASINYEFFLPCNVPTPYAADTDLEFDLTKLIVGEDYHYRYIVKNANGTNTGRDQSVQTFAVLDLKTDPATDLDPGAATLNGTVNPDGYDTEFFYQYGISQNYTQKTPKVKLPPTTGAAALPPTEITGLQPGRVYHYRLIARNKLGTTKGEDRSFIVPATPRISAVRVTNVSDTDATLNAGVNPFGFDTTYHFEYGKTPSYGDSLPEASIGAGEVPVAVTGDLSGLDPGVTYHFRVVATNKWGTTISPDSNFSFQAPACPNEHVRQQTNATYLPDCRAYEIVSPEDAGAVQLYPGGVSDGVGGGFAFGTELGIEAPNPAGRASSPARFGFFGGAGAIAGLHPPNVLVDRYVSTRTNEGWVTTYPGRSGKDTLIAVKPLCNIEMSICIDSEYGDLFGGPPGEPEEPFLNHAAHVWGVEGNSLGRWPTNLDVVEGGSVAAQKAIRSSAPSGDFSHFVFSSEEVPFAPGGVEGPPGSVYDNDISDKTVKIASLLPNGLPIPQGSGGGEDEFLRIQAVSERRLAHPDVDSVPRRKLQPLPPRR